MCGGQRPTTSHGGKCGVRQWVKLLQRRKCVKQLRGRKWERESHGSGRALNRGGEQGGGGGEGSHLEKGSGPRRQLCMLMAIRSTTLPAALMQSLTQPWLAMRLKAWLLCCYLPCCACLRPLASLLLLPLLSLCCSCCCSSYRRCSCCLYCHRPCVQCGPHLLHRLLRCCVSGAVQRGDAADHRCGLYGRRSFRGGWIGGARWRL